MRSIDSIPAVIDAYEAYLILERGLSDNTREAYVRDVGKLVRYLETEKVTLREVTTDTLRAFAADLFDLGISPRTQARIVSGIKSFFRFLKLEGYLDSNPSLLLESPALRRHLPEVLRLDEIDAMIGAIDMEKAEGQRNRAIMETLYGCGLRVSELINLEISKLYFDEQFIMVHGKGDKERIVPISPQAIREIKDYLPDRALLPVKRGEENILFLNRRGHRLTRVMIFYIIKQLASLSFKFVKPDCVRFILA